MVIVSVSVQSATLLGVIWKCDGLILVLPLFCWREPLFHRYLQNLTSYTEINLNGSIVANAGFIHRLFGATAKTSPSQYVSAWGGIQSAGQFIGQVLLQFGTDKLGRKAAFFILWAMLVIASTFIDGLI